MSDLNDFKSKPIPINYTKSIYGFSSPFNFNNKYLFDLTIKFKDKKEISFKRLEDKKKSAIINIDDNVEFKNLDTFDLSVTLIPDGIEDSHIMTGKIPHDVTSHIQNDEKLFLEFSQNETGKTICYCYFLGNDIIHYGVTPPN